MFVVFLMEAKTTDTEFTCLSLVIFNNLKDGETQ